MGDLTPRPPRLLGFARTSDEITSVISSDVRQLIKRRQLTVDDGHVSLVA